MPVTSNMLARSAYTPLASNNAIAAANPLWGCCCLALCEVNKGVLIMEWLWKNSLCIYYTCSMWMSSLSIELVRKLDTTPSFVITETPGSAIN
jgi:hypothetical protein